MTSIDRSTNQPVNHLVKPVGSEIGDYNVIYISLLQCLLFEALVIYALDAAIQFRRWRDNTEDTAANVTATETLSSTRNVEYNVS